MDQLRRVLANIAKSLGQMNTTQKLLVGSLGVILAMSLFVVAQYSGAGQYVEVFPGASGADGQRISDALTKAGIEFRPQNGSIAVPPEKVDKARAAVLQSGSGLADTGLLFRNIIEKQSWQMSRQQNEQLYAVALQNELSSIISNFSGIEKATVIIDAPDRAGLGKSVLMPTASVMVATKNSAALTQETVDGIAHLIAGAKAGLRPEDVRVIDASHGGRQRKTAGEGESAPSNYLEQAGKVEQLMQTKLSDQFSYIPGAIITVTAKVDVTRMQSTTTKHLEKGDGTVTLPRRTTDKNSNTSQTTPSAEPGLGSNITADITRANAKPGSSMTETNEEREMENQFGTRIETSVDPKGMPTMIAVSVNVPRSYVIGLLKQSAPAPASSGAPAVDPADADIQKKFTDDVRPSILSQILPHVLAMSGEFHSASDAAALTKLLASNVAVSLIPFDAAPPGVPGGMVGGGGGLSSGGSGGGIGVVLGMSGLVEKGALGLLAMVSVGMMLLMVKKASRRVELPKAEELVGLPPALDASSDILGEATEGDTALAGIEVDEAEMAATKMLEQVSELVKKDPDSAAKLINRWIVVES